MLKEFVTQFLLILSVVWCWLWSEACGFWLVARYLYLLFVCFTLSLSLNNPARSGVDSMTHDDVRRFARYIRYADSS